MCDADTIAEAVATFPIQNNIGQETVALVESEGFNSVASISPITPELFNRHFGCLPLAQRLLLSEAVERLLQNKTEGKPTSTEKRPLSTLEYLLDLWKKNTKKTVCCEP